MKKTAIAILAAAISLPLLCPDCSAADEEPSYEACSELVGSDARMCQDKVAAYWDNRLNAAYRQVNPLEPGYADRRDLYNLYHLLNHLNLFGPGYLPPVLRIIGRYG